MLKLILNRFTDPLGLPIAYEFEFAIIGLFYLFAYNIAWNKIPGIQNNRKIYWSVRILLFILIWVILYYIIYLAKIIFSY